MPITVAPILRTIGNFDANKDKKITFTINGMNIIPRLVRVIISDNNTNESLYDNTSEITITNLTHTIPAGSLVNNKYYNCYITITDNNNLISPQSNTVPFYCITTPTFEFLNIPNIITQSNIDPTLKYEQNGSIYDPLMSFNIKLYNSQNNLVYDSNTIYVTETTQLQVSLKDLEEDSYKIIAQGETLNNLQLQTIQEFSVYYDSPVGFQSMYLDNLYEQGQIRLTSNIIGLIGTMHGEEIYIDNSMLDLRDENSYLEFNKGFLIRDNLYFKI